MKTPDFNWSNFITRIDLWICAVLILLTLSWVMSSFSFGEFVEYQRASGYHESLLEDRVIFGYDNPGKSWTIPWLLRFVGAFGIHLSSQENYSVLSEPGWVTILIPLLALVVALIAITRRGYSDALYLLGPLVLLSSASYWWLLSELRIYSLRLENPTTTFVSAAFTLGLGSLGGLLLARLAEPWRNTLPVDFSAPH